MEEDFALTSQSTPASVRRELWRDTQQQSVGSIEEFCQDEREARYEALPDHSRSPHSSFSSPQVSVDSPRISFSPLQIKDSIEEEEEEEEMRCGPVTFRSQSLTVPGYCTPPTLSVHTCEGHDGGRSPRGRAVAHRGGHTASLHRNSLHPGGSQFSPRARSVSPISLMSRCGPGCVSCPRSPVPTNYGGHYETFFRARWAGPEQAETEQDPGDDSDLYRRWMSDTDISSDCLEGVSTLVNISQSHSQDIQDPPDSVFFTTARYPITSSVESDQSSAQEFPLDLSIRSSMSSTSTSESSSKMLFPGRRQHVLSSSLSSESGGSRGSDCVKHSLVVNSPSQGGADLLTSAQWVCPLCQQSFGLHDRLAKHMASRHKEHSTVNSRAGVHLTCLGKSLGYVFRERGSNSCLRMN